MNKIIVIFGIIFLIFLVVIVFFQVNTKSINKLLNKPATNTVNINGATFKVELAKTQKELAEGLSGRGSLPQDGGMLFVFDKPSYYFFWMRGMKFPLDIIFILNNKVVAVYEDLPPASVNEANPPQYGLDTASDRVLEINAGRARRNNIKVGDRVIIDIK